MFLSLDEGWETPASENILIEDLKFIKFNILFFDYKSYIYIYMDFSPIPTFLIIWDVPHLRNL